MAKQISLRAVSEPREKDVPGTLFEIVHGITVIGMRKGPNIARFSYLRNAHLPIPNAPGSRGQAYRMRAEW